MSFTAPNSQCDLIRALRKLGPLDEDAFKSIAEILGYGVKKPVPDPVPLADAQETKPDREVSQAPAADATPSPQPGRERKPLESEILHIGESENLPPDWLQTVPHLEEASPSKLMVGRPLEPLFEPSWTRTILSDALSTPGFGGEPDVEAIVERIGHAQPLTELPRRPAPTLARGVQLLLDCSEAMEPFASDQVLLKDEVLNVVGKDRTQALSFYGSPLWGTENIPGEELAEYEPPPSGTPVLVLTDLGIGRTALLSERAHAGDWMEFATLLRRSNCSVIAFVPYPETRWPDLQRTMPILQWDRPTNASAVRSLVRLRLNIAGKS